MSEPAIFSLNSGHVSFLDNVVGIIDKNWVNTVAIGGVKETMPAVNNVPQRFKSCGTPRT